MKCPALLTVLSLMLAAPAGSWAQQEPSAPGPAMRFPAPPVIMPERLPPAPVLSGLSTEADSAAGALIFTGALVGFAVGGGLGALEMVLVKDRSPAAVFLLGGIGAVIGSQFGMSAEARRRELAREPGAPPREPVRAAPWVIGGAGVGFVLGLGILTLAQPTDALQLQAGFKVALGGAFLGWIIANARWEQ